jgi:hypothetical protein
MGIDDAINVFVISYLAGSLLSLKYFFLERRRKLSKDN